MKKISIIIPCYNCAKYLPKCFISLVEQTMDINELELIFVNDCSTDGGATWDMLCDFETAYPQSVIIIDLPDNRRQGGARNEALQYASGEYILFADADDWVLPDMCDKLYDTAKDCDADIVQFGHSLYFDGVGIIDSKFNYHNEIIRIENDEQRRNFLMSEKLPYGCCFKLYRTGLIAASGVRFAEHVVYEEPLFVYPLLFMADTFAIVPDRLYVYRQNSGGTMRSDMLDNRTLKMHSDVQLAVWNFMKNTPYISTFYEEIKLYFLHTYLYETMLFAKDRGYGLPDGLYDELTSTAMREVSDITCCRYADIIPKQMQVYLLVTEGAAEEEVFAVL